MRGSKIKDTKYIEELYGNHEIKMSMEEHDLEIIYENIESSRMCGTSFWQKTFRWTARKPMRWATSTIATNNRQILTFSKSELIFDSLFLSFIENYCKFAHGYNNAIVLTNIP